MDFEANPGRFTTRWWWLARSKPEWRRCSNSSPRSRSNRPRGSPPTKSAYHIDQRLAEITDKLDGLIGFMDNFIRNRPESGD
jgi:hypothetical protein